MLRGATVMLTLLLHCSLFCDAWIVPIPTSVRSSSPRFVIPAESQQEPTMAPALEVEQLIDMDVVIYSMKEDNESENDSPNGNCPKSSKLRLAALQQDGVLSPLSVWTTEAAFGESIEFLVDEADRFSLVNCMEKVRLHRLLSEEELSYGSRQCHRGVGNPHGEESELLYYIEKDVIDQFQVEVIIKPELEILW